MAFQNNPKGNMLIIQPLRLRQRNNKLTSIAVSFPAIAHGQHVRPVVIDFKILVLKRLPIYRFASHTRAMRKVSSLNEKVWNNSMKRGSLVA